MIGYVISKQERNFFKKIFNKLDEVAPRRKFIEENAKYVKNLDV